MPHTVLEPVTSFQSKRHVSGIEKVISHCTECFSLCASLSFATDRANRAHGRARMSSTTVCKRPVGQIGGGSWAGRNEWKPCAKRGRSASASSGAERNWKLELTSRVLTLNVSTAWRTSKLCRTWNCVLPGVLVTAPFPVTWRNISRDHSCGSCVSLSF